MRVSRLDQRLTLSSRPCAQRRISDGHVLGDSVCRCDLRCSYVFFLGLDSQAMHVFLVGNQAVECALLDDGAIWAEGDFEISGSVFNNPKRSWSEKVF